MVKYNNTINRLGNTEIDMKHVKHLLPEDVKLVAEPFSGSFAVIQHFYKNLENITSISMIQKKHYSMPSNIIGISRM